MVFKGCERSVITYSSLISACEKAGQSDLALELFAEMAQEGCVPNTVTYNSLITACAQGAPPTPPSTHPPTSLPCSCWHTSSRVQISSQKISFLGVSGRFILLCLEDDVATFGMALCGVSVMLEGPGRLMQQY